MVVTYSRVSFGGCEEGKKWYEGFSRFGVYKLQTFVIEKKTPKKRKVGS
jgi:hypothetical protein